MRFLVPRNLEGKLVCFNFNIRIHNSIFLLPFPFLFHPPSFFPLLGGLSIFTMTTVNFRIFSLSKKEEEEKEGRTHTLTSSHSSSLSTGQLPVNLPFHIYLLILDISFLTV